MTSFFNFTIVLFLFFSACPSNAQRNIRLMFYNVENLFDTTDDPTVNDNEYLPDGSYYWTYKKYNEKLQNIYKVITSIGQWSAPEIVALCEVENRIVLNDLITKTPLSKYKYSIVHFNSPDPRGIDVALLYKTENLSVVSEKNIPVLFNNARESKTRGILLVKLLWKKKEHLYVFVNHWPSRRSGERETDSYRMYAARILKSHVDSLFMLDKNANIVITGDFNDEPFDDSLVKGLKVNNSTQNPLSANLYNISTHFLKEQKTGTIKHQGLWHIFDQIIVSGPLLFNKKGIVATTGKANVFNAPFLLQADKRHLGYMPFRTYSGRKYTGGFSDHLPVYIDFTIQ